MVESECHRTSCRVDIHQIKDLDFNLDDPKIQVDLNFLTHRTVGKKRKDLFNHKVQFQNQLNTLKEKGRRLLIADKVDLHQFRIM